MLSLDQDRYDHHGIVTRVVADRLWGPTPDCDAGVIMVASGA